MRKAINIKDQMSQIQEYDSRTKSKSSRGSKSPKRHKSKTPNTKANIGTFVDNSGMMIGKKSIQPTQTPKFQKRR